MQFGLIGEKLSHSYSKEIHERLGDYEYELHPLPPAELADFMRRRNFCGVNVTIPYKQAVMPLCDEVDERARRIGAVNTVVNRGGRLVGYNTDNDGLLYTLRRHGIGLGGKTVLVLGSGGTAQTFHAVARDEGAKEVLTASRSGGEGRLSYGQAAQRRDVDIVANCSPAGMYPHNGGTLLELEGLTALCAVVDAVYNPFKTELVLRAQARGLCAVGGFEMLVAQAAVAAAHFVGGTVADEQIDEVAQDMLGRLCNLSLVGMPGCGKTSLGKALAKLLGKRFVDLDAEIVREAGMDIPAIFEQFGEAHFRRLEAEIAHRVSAESGQVISTGGGIVKSEANVRALRQNGPVLFIDCPVERLAISGGRPLAKDREDLQRLYGQRLPLYRAAADAAVPYHPYFKENTARLQRAFTDTLAGGWAAGNGCEKK